MRRSLIVLPIAVFTSACGLVPFTPSTPVRYDTQVPPAGPAIVAPARQDAISAWQLPPSNPWAPYEKLTLLSSLDTVPRAAELPDVIAFPIVAEAQNAAMAVAAAGLPADTAWFVDLRGAASVAFGAALSHRAGDSVAAVLTFNNWPAENELIPAAETLAALLRFTPRLPRSSEALTRPVFLLDAWRLAYRDSVPEDDYVDNRYMLNSTDLPDAETVRAQGIRHVIYVVEDLDETDVEEDDLHVSFLEYQRAGISITMVDLKTLTRNLDTPDRWPVLRSNNTLRIGERRTLLDDPGFYARSRGGFGGIPSGPSPFYHPPGQPPPSFGRFGGFGGG